MTGQTVHAWDGTVVLDPVTAMTLAAHLDAAAAGATSALAGELRAAARTARVQERLKRRGEAQRVDVPVVRPLPLREDTFAQHAAVALAVVKDGGHHA